MDDIKIVYHPKTGKEPLIQSLADYNAADSKIRTPSRSYEEPWAPYKTRLDFEFSEFVMTAYLNKDHVEKLIALLELAASGEDKLTIANNAELVKIRETSSELLTPVCYLCANIRACVDITMLLVQENRLIHPL